MNVGQLKTLIANLPDAMQVVTSGTDHSYRHVQGTIRRAEKYVACVSMNTTLLEYIGDANKSDPSSPVIDVLVIL